MIDGFYDLVARVEARIMARVQQMVMSVAKYTVVSNATPSGNSDGVEGWSAGTTRRDDPQTEQDVVRRMSTWGVRSVPPNGVAACIVRAGGATNGIMVGNESSKYGPGDLKAGEVAIYNTDNAVIIKLAVDGTITINSDAVAGKNIILNGGALNSARETDPISVGTLIGVAAIYPVNFTYTPTVGNPATGNAAGAPVGPQLTAVLTGAIGNATGGAPPNGTTCALHVKA